MILRYAAGFGMFWYRFIVGDDWTLAASILAGLVATYALLRAGVAAWWLMALVAAGALALSVWRARSAKV